MPAEENKTIVRRYIEEIWNKKNYGASAEFIAPTCTVNGQSIGGPEGANAWAKEWHTYFPDQHKTIEEEIAAGDTVVIHFTEHGTHQGTLWGIPATGKQFSWPVIAIFRLEDGKIVAIKAQGDMLGLQEQLRGSATPTPAST